MILLITIPLACIVAFVSYVGLTQPEFYFLESRNWQAQTYGQDLIDLFVAAPALAWSAIKAHGGNTAWRSAWAGVLAYLAYTFAIYSFDIHFNALFLPYCFALGFSVYGIIYFALAASPESGSIGTSPALRKTTAIYFVVIAVAFYLLWLLEIVPANLAGMKPRSLAESGLSSNPVYVLDLALILPGIFITGILLLKDHRLGRRLAPMVLAFFILMDITIAGLTWIMLRHGFGSGFAVGYSMITLALFSAVLFALYVTARHRVS